MTTLRFTDDPDADRLLAEDPLALLIGMLLDQQITMEAAFYGPRLLAERLGVSRLDAAQIADYEPEAFHTLFAGPPAVHRYHGSMAKRVQQLCRALVADYGGSAEAVWSDAKSGEELLRRLEGLPGFGEQKAKIFTAVLGKRLGVRPRGWRTAAGHYGEDGVYRSVADVTGPDAVEKVREYKRSVKAAAKDKAKAAR